MKTLTMGTRGSALALAQARAFARDLEAIHSNLKVEERVIRTTGDKQQGQPLPEIGGKGVFTLEIEDALLNSEIDFAVHSLKDLPPHMPEGLVLACVPLRESPADALILRSDSDSWKSANAEMPELPMGARVGTSSLRRAAMVKHIRPDLTVESVRGNVETRLMKLETQGFHAIILARAGLRRLEVEGIDARNLPESWFIPAPGQGALAIQSRIDDVNTRAILMGLEDAATRAAIEAERAIVIELNAGCSTPLGALARAYGEAISINAAVLSLDGTRRISVNVQGSGAPEVIGGRAARSLLDKGALELLVASE